MTTCTFFMPIVILAVGLCILRKIKAVDTLMQYSRVATVALTVAARLLSRVSPIDLLIVADVSVRSPHSGPRMLSIK